MKRDNCEWIARNLLTITVTHYAIIEIANMKLNHTIRFGVRQLALFGLLFTPIALTSAYAAELIGKPVPVLGSSEANAAPAAETAPKASPAPSAEPAPDNAPSAELSAEAKTDLYPQPAPPPPPEHYYESDDTGRNIESAIQHIAPALKDAFGHDESSGFDPALLIPLFGIVFLFGGPIFLIIMLATMHYRSKSHRQQAINNNIDKLLASGRDIPVELLRGDEPYVMEGDRNLARGLRNLGLGLGLLVFLTILCGIEIGAIGFILIGLGVSRILIWKLSGTRVESKLNGNTTHVARVQD